MCCPYLLGVWILTFCTFKFIISLKNKKESTIQITPALFIWWVRWHIFFMQQTWFWLVLEWLRWRCTMQKLKTFTFRYLACHIRGEGHQRDNIWRPTDILNIWSVLCLCSWYRLSDRHLDRNSWGNNIPLWIQTTFGQPGAHWARPGIVDWALTRIDHYKLMIVCIAWVWNNGLTWRICEVEKINPYVIFSNLDMVSLFSRNKLWHHRHLSCQPASASAGERLPLHQGRFNQCTSPKNG